jgi:hypothetical protein
MNGGVPLRPGSAEVRPRSEDGRTGLAELVASAIARPRQPTRRDSGLPVAQLSLPVQPSSNHYLVTTVDDRGRLADRSALRLLAWEPGSVLRFTVLHGAIMVSPAPDGIRSVTRQGHLRLPAPVRRACDISRGDRLLVLASRDQKLLVVYTASILDSVLLTHHQVHLDGKGQ